MKFLWLRDDLTHQIIDHTRSMVPREACGLIVGHEGKAEKIIPIRNVAVDPAHHYQMDHIELSRQLPALDHAGLDLIGFYHSHPSGEPIPSPVDIAQANYSDTAYLIVGLKNNEPRLAAWLINSGRVARLSLHMGTLPPQDFPEIDQPLSSPQKTAAIISALLALTLLIVLSLMLLPPAPVIP